jgi:hypothetical protein
MKSWEIRRKIKPPLKPIQTVPKEEIPIRLIPMDGEGSKTFFIGN